MKCKVGDKLICKKHYNSPYSAVKFIIGECYFIGEIESYFNVIFLVDKNNKDLLWFYSKRSERYIWNYFYTEKEMRRLKLKNLG